MAKKKPREEHWYSAKILYQFRVEIEGVSNKRRTCEIRVILLRARSSKEALRMAKKRGKAGEAKYQNSEGNTVFFELVGVMDLLQLGLECQRDEVWYEILELMTPMERKAALIPADDDLCRNETTEVPAPDNVKNVCELCNRVLI